MPADNELINESVSARHRIAGTLSDIAEQVSALQQGLDPIQSQSVEHISHQTGHATKLNDALSLLATSVIPPSSRQSWRVLGQGVPADTTTVVAG